MNLAAKNAKSAKKTWPMVRLGDVCKVVYGTRVRRKDSEGDAYPVYGGGGETFRWNTYNREDQCVVSRFAMSEECVRFVKGKFFLNDSGLTVDSNDERLLQCFLDWFLYSEQDGIYALGKGSAQKNLDVDDFVESQIPLPPLSVQREIVARLEKELGEADALAAKFKGIAENADAEFKAELDETFKNVEGEKVRLGDVGRVAMCKRILKAQTKDIGDIPFYKIGTFGKSPNAYISRAVYDEYVKKYSYPTKGDILISAAGTIGRAVVFDGEPAYFQDSNIVWLEHDRQRLLNEYLLYFYLSNPYSISVGVTIPRIYNGDIESLEIPAPPLAAQREIVSMLDASKEKCEKLKAAAERGLRAAEDLRKAILAEAFEQ